MSKFNIRGIAIPKVVALIAGCAMSTGASAITTYGNTYNIGTLGPVPYVNHTTVSGTFSDIYNFSISNTPNVAGAAVTISLNLGSVEYHISNLSLGLFTSSNTMLDSDTVTNNTTDVAVTVSDTGLANGNYYFKVTGVADGLNTGMGIYGFTAAAVVPEVDTYAMLLAGLGLVAFSVNRRKQHN